MSSTSADLFELIAADLKTQVEELGGVFSVARDPFEVIELLAEAPGRFRVILAEGGEEPAGDSRRGAVVQITYTVTVSHNRGLSVIKGAGIATQRAGDSSLMELCREVRDWMRGIALPIDGQQTSGKLDYRGRTIVEYEGAQLDAFELKFVTFAGLPAPTTRP